MKKWIILLILVAAIPLGAQVYDVETFAGPTADVKLNACLTEIASGGVCDARTLGATTRTIAATVSIGVGKSNNGYSAPYQTVIFSPATTFVPTSSTTQMFNLGIGASVDGLTIATGGVSNYSTSAIQFSSAPTNTSWFYLGANLKNTRVFDTLANNDVPKHHRQLALASQ